ncbi:hypothetical protein RUND412_004998 [Rhizina undulata]
MAESSNRCCGHDSFPPKPRHQSSCVASYLRNMEPSAHTVPLQGVLVHIECEQNPYTHPMLDSPLHDTLSLNTFPGRTVYEEFAITETYEGLRKKHLECPIAGTLGLPLMCIPLCLLDGTRTIDFFSMRKGTIGDKPFITDFTAFAGMYSGLYEHLNELHDAAFWFGTQTCFFLYRKDGKRLYREHVAVMTKLLRSIRLADLREITRRSTGYWGVNRYLSGEDHFISFFRPRCCQFKDTFTPTDFSAFWTNTKNSLMLGWGVDDIYNWSDPPHPFDVIQATQLSYDELVASTHFEDEVSLSNVMQLNRRQAADVVIGTMFFPKASHGSSEERDEELDIELRQITTNLNGKFQKKLPAESTRLTAHRVGIPLSIFVDTEIKIDVDQFTPAYTPEDFLEALTLYLGCLLWSENESTETQWNTGVRHMGKAGIPAVICYRLDGKPLFPSHLYILMRFVKSYSYRMSKLQLDDDSVRSEFLEFYEKTLKSELEEWHRKGWDMHPSPFEV